MKACRVLLQSAHTCTHASVLPTAMPAMQDTSLAAQGVTFKNSIHLQQYGTRRAQAVVEGHVRWLLQEGQGGQLVHTSADVQQEQQQQALWAPGPHTSPPLPQVAGGLLLGGGQAASAQQQPIQHAIGAQGPAGSGLGITGGRVTKHTGTAQRKQAAASKKKGPTGPSGPKSCKRCKAAGLVQVTHHWKSGLCPFLCPGCTKATNSKVEWR